MNKARGRASAVPFTPVDSDTEVLWVSNKEMSILNSNKGGVFSQSTVILQGVTKRMDPLKSGCKNDWIF